MDYDSFLELIKTRRSIRQFKSNPIPDECVDKIIEAARWAPSGFNTQPWEFVIVRDQKLRDDIVQIIGKDREHNALMETARESWQVKPKAEMPAQPPGQAVSDYSKAPVFIILLGDTRTHVGLPMTRRFNYPQLQLAYISGLASAMLYMHLAATTLGLASQWVSGVGNAYGHCLIKKLLGIPQALEIYDMMVVGYSGYKPRPRLVRDREEMTHCDYCGERAFRTDEAVRDFIVKIRNP